MIEFHTYLSSLPNPDSFSATKLLEVMSRFQTPFESHFRSEISTIASLANHANSPKEGSLEERRARATFESWGERSIIQGGVTDVALFFLFNHDKTYEGGLWSQWPPMPSPLRWSLVNVGKLAHAGWWKFATCDGAGKPKPLHAAG
jgi:hypothetical protein